MSYAATSTLQFLHWLTVQAPKGGVLHNLSLFILFAVLVGAMFVVKNTIAKNNGKTRTLKFS